MPLEPPIRWNAEERAWETTLRGRGVLSEPRINKGIAFTLEERASLGLVGLLPGRVMTIEEQVDRAYRQYLSQPSDLDRNIFLTGLHDRNEVLFFRLLEERLPEMLPVVYTPTVGEAIQRYSLEYRRPRGAYLSIRDAGAMESALLAATQGDRDLDLLVATDAEGILGIGDWGVGGIEIAVGKLNVYTAAAGINPTRTLAVMLDVGTNRQELLDDPLYVGCPHPRVGRAEYDAFVDRYVRVASALFPDAMLHWEDFGPDNARRILNRYRSQVLTFNDDMQGTGAVTLAAVLSASRAAGVPLTGHRVVVFGGGTAGIGIAEQLRDAMVADGLDRGEATSRFWPLGRHGLFQSAHAGLLRDFQLPYARDTAELAGWETDADGNVGLLEVVRRVRPTILIGTSGRGGAFTEQVVRAMAEHAERPIIMPMSNPTSLSEAHPADVLRWTDGRALVATGSPFPPVDLGGTTFQIGQANNALVFPGIGLGVIAARASRVTDGMLYAAARAVAGLVDADRPGSPLLPQVADLRRTSLAVAEAVARQAVADGVATDAGDVSAAVWRAEYHPVLAV